MKEMHNSAPSASHRDQDDLKRPTTSDDLVRLLNEQLDDNIDRRIPFGRFGSYGAPFKLTCIVHGYIVIGKGTTSCGNKSLVKRRCIESYGRPKAQRYLSSLQSIWPKSIFCGGRDSSHASHWGGENTEMKPWLRNPSTKEIKALGVHDLRYDNVLWNKELGRALIIDFHRDTLNHRSLKTGEEEVVQTRVGRYPFDLVHT
ncbi:hypothetical protein N7447_004482 [Penicillium robsamsonii]|uniref:uncharacterized protein n=1 Tax=Penicillium robsamsonii TaxID=1792511 RepID=UPI0025478010|nr:uncharacterized protein N7447_004482 [Penicillium robsamsonii]KAJ5827719.1 hypothetical protein N7447_004482 [Penicillium robsamsonii]